MFALIMAGGNGTRLWPASRQKTPKQLQGFIHDKTLLQTTFARLKKGFSSKEVYIATSASHASQVKRQLPLVSPDRYSIEPAPRDIGPALGLAALIMHNHSPKASFVTVWSDHYIQNEEGFHRTLKEAKKLLKLRPEAVIATGAIPQYPHTGFRYIQLGKKYPNKFQIAAYHAKSFKDKPAETEAKKYFRSGQYLWNTGYFICRCDTLLDLYREHAPEVFKNLQKIKPFLGTKKQQQAVNRHYPQMPKMDFELEIIMKLKNRLLAITAEFDWIDVGSWRTVKDVLSKPHENLIKGKVLAHGTDSSLIYNYEDKLVSTVGVKNLVLVNTKDALLVMDKNSSEKIKEVVSKLKEDGQLAKYL